jgi:hypothetical protein
MSITVQRLSDISGTYSYQTRLIHHRLSLSAPFIQVIIQHHLQPLYCGSGKTRKHLVYTSTRLLFSGRSHTQPLRAAVYSFIPVDFLVSPLRRQLIDQSNTKDSVSRYTCNND